MPVAPGYLRQSGLPKSSGQRGLPSVQVNDSIGQSLTQAGGFMGAISDQMREIQSGSDLSQAQVNATLKLSKLETSMSTMDGSPDVINEHFANNKEIIFEEAASHIADPRVRKKFADNYGVLSAQSQVKIQSAGVKRKFDRAEGDLHIALDQYARGIAMVKGKPTKVDVDTAMRMGLADIDRAVKSGVIKADVAAKRAIKYVTHLADNAVVGWLNDPAGGTTRSKLLEMEAGKFADKDIQKYWGIIGSDERKKAGLISRAITNISRSLAFNDKKDAKEKAALVTASKQSLLEYYTIGTSQDRKHAIVAEAAKNPEFNPNAYNQMVKDLSGLSERFDDPKKKTQLQLRIMRTPHEVTDEDIVAAGFSGPTTSAFLKLKNTEDSARTKRAKEMLLRHPVFIPKNRADKRTNALGVEQAEVWTTVLEEMTEAEDKGKSYDPVARTKELIKEFEEKGKTPDGEKATAQTELRNLGITKAEDVEVWISANIVKHKLTTSRINQIRAWGAKAF